MRRGSVVVQKTKPMVADEIVRALGAKPWDKAHLKKLSRPTLLKLAERTVPDFATVYKET